MYIDNSNKTSKPGTSKKSADDVSWVKDYVEKQIATRALQKIEPIIDYMRALDILKFTVAGGALFKGPCNDIDIWPCPYDYDNYRKLFNTKVPIDLNKKIQYFEQKFGETCKVQFCIYPVLPIGELIETFDFAHCKAAAAIEIDKDSGKVHALGRVSPDFIASMAAQTTFYCQSHEFPLRSIYRVGKVAQKLNMTGDEARDLGCQVVSSLIKQGFDKIASKDPDLIEYLAKYGDK